MTTQCNAITYTQTGAHISPHGQYRYSLQRIWDRSKGVVLWVMLNPSTADADTDDPTIRRCVGFASDWGYGGIEVRNLFSLRSTDPKVIRTHSEPNDYGNKYVVGVASRFPLCVAAWGVGGEFQYRGEEVVRQFQEMGIPLYCLGKTKNGQPKHPLYLPKSAKLILV